MPNSMAAPRATRRRRRRHTSERRADPGARRECVRTPTWQARRPRSRRRNRRSWPERWWSKGSRALTGIARSATRSGSGALLRASLLPRSVGSWGRSSAGPECLGFRAAVNSRVGVCAAPYRPARSYERCCRGPRPWAAARRVPQSLTSTKARVHASASRSARGCVWARAGSLAQAPIYRKVPVVS